MKLSFVQSRDFEARWAIENRSGRLIRSTAIERIETDRSTVERTKKFFEPKINVYHSIYSRDTFVIFTYAISSRSVSTVGRKRA